MNKKQALFIIFLVAIAFVFSRMIFGLDEIIYVAIGVILSISCVVLIVGALFVITGLYSHLGDY